MKLRNKTAIVTGANSGMGMATAKAFLAEGATVSEMCSGFERLLAELEKDDKPDTAE